MSSKNSMTSTTRAAISFTVSAVPWKKDTFFKKFTAQSFYRLMMAMGVDIVYNHADCRLMSKRSLYDLEQFKEVKSVPAGHRAPHRISVCSGDL